MGLGVLSQVECFEAGSGEFLHTTNLVKDSNSLTLEQESISRRGSSKIPNFCLRSRKGKGRGKFVCFRAVQEGEILLDHTAFRVICLWWENSFKVSAIGGRGPERGQKRGN